MSNRWIHAFLVAGVLGAALLPAMGSAEESVLDPKRPRDPNDIVYGGRGVNERSVIAGVCSLLIPGVGQAINRNQSKKILTHGVIGLVYFVGFAHPIGFVFGLFHIWSAWDAFIVRPGGYFNGTVLVPESWQDASTGVAEITTA